MVHIDRETVFTFLYQLQASGVTNMFGGAKYLMSHFGLDFDEASDWLKQWMKEYERAEYEVAVAKENVADFREMADELGDA